MMYCFFNLLIAFIRCYVFLINLLFIYLLEQFPKRSVGFIPIFGSFTILLITFFFYCVFGSFGFVCPVIDAWNIVNIYFYLIDY